MNSDTRHGQKFNDRPLCGLKVRKLLARLTQGLRDAERDQRKPRHLFAIPPHRDLKKSYIKTSKMIDFHKKKKNSIIFDLLSCNLIISCYIVCQQERTGNEYGTGIT